MNPNKAIYSKFLSLTEAQNQSKSGGISIPATFLRVTGSV